MQARPEDEICIHLPRTWSLRPNTQVSTTKNINCLDAGNVKATAPLQASAPLDQDVEEGLRARQSAMATILSAAQFLLVGR